VKGIMCFGIGMTLREGNREFFYQKLDRSFPGLKEKYMKQYGNSYELRSHNHDSLIRLIYETCNQNDIIIEPEKVFHYLRTLDENRFEQIEFQF
jgi:hypothetical protein